MPDRRPRPERETPRRERLCKRCGRAFAWRREWARDWEVRRYCSDACRGAIPDGTATALEAAILELLAERGPEKTICPSEAAKAVGGRESRHDWESLMEPARDAARRLAAKKRIVITQKDKIVDPVTATGAIRLRLP